MCCRDGATPEQRTRNDYAVAELGKGIPRMVRNAFIGEGLVYIS